MIRTRKGGPGEGKCRKENKQKRLKKALRMKCLQGRKRSPTEMSHRRSPNQTLNSDYIVSRNERMLVTGSSGFIGVKVVEILLKYGFTKLRCLVRPTSQLERLEKALKQFDASQDVEIVKGDLLSSDDCRRIAEGVSIVYHLAAGFDKSFAGAFMNSALATRNLMDAFLERG